MIKRKTVTFLALLLLFLSAQPTAATTNSEQITIINKTTTEVTARATATANSGDQESQQQDQQIVRQEISNKIDQKTQTRLRNLSGIFTNRLSGLIERLNSIISRLEARLVIIEQQNQELEVSEIKATIENAKNSLALAEKQTADLTNQLDSFVQLETDPFQVIQQAKDSFREIHALLLSVRQDLTKAIGLIRGLRIGN